MADDKRSPLWGAAASASLAGGVGAGLYLQRQNIANIFKTGKTDVAGRAANVAAGLPKFQVSSTFKRPQPVPNLSKAMRAMAANVANLTPPRSIDPINLSKMAPLLKFNLAAATDIELKNLTYQAIMAGGMTPQSQALQAIGMIGENKGIAAQIQAANKIVSTYKGDLGVFEKGIRNIGSETNIGLMRGMTTPTSGVIGQTKFFMKTSALDDFSRAKYFNIRDQINEALGGVKASQSWKFKYVKDFNDITTPMAVGTIEGVKFNIPLSHTGFTYGGADLTSRYAVRKGYDLEGKTMGYSDFYVEKIKRAIAGSQTSNVSLRENLLKATQETIDLNSPKTAAVWTQPFMGAGGLAKARLISQEAVPFETIDPEDVPKMFSRGLFPYTSPDSAAKGVLSTQNVATGIFGDLGLLMSAEKRPTQFARSEWSATARAKDLAVARSFSGTFGRHFSRLERKIHGDLYQKIIYGNANLKPTDTAAYTTPQLLTFYAKPASGGVGVGYKTAALDVMLSPEEGVISRQAARMLEHERIIEKNILVHEDMMINKRILEAVSGQQPSAKPIMFDKPIGLGEFIGIEYGTGKRITTEAEGAIQDVIGVQVLGGNEAKVLIRERHNLGENQLWKFMSEENKFMAGAVDDDTMRAVLRASGLGDIKSIAGQDIEAVFNAKLIGKNKMAQINQQIEAAAMFIGERLDKKQTLVAGDVAMLSFLQDPAAALNVKEIMQSNARDASVQIQKNLLGLTRKAGFTDLEMQLTFGMLHPEAAAQLEAETGLKGFAELVERSPGVIGIGKGRMSDLAAAGAGGRGSVESSALRMLAMKGDVGERYAAEIAGRVVGKGEYVAANKMLGSVLGQESFFSQLKRIGNIQSFSNLNLNQLPETGGYYDLGRKFAEMGGSSAIYVPGTKEAAGLLTPNITPKGEMIETPLVQELKSFQQKLTNRTLSEADIEKSALSLRNLVAEQTAAQIAVKKGKVIGSKLLTGYRRDLGPEGVFNISPDMAKGMFRDLRERATDKDQIEFLLRQEKMAMEGKVMTGGMWRHPTTGPESFQFIRYKVDKRVADGMLAAPTKFGKISLGGGEFKDIDISEMVGFKGDFDRDQYVISAIANRDTEARVAKMMGGQIDKEYTKYLFNHYAMKDAIEGKLSKSEVLGMASLEEGYRQLTTSKTTTGQVNMALQKLKIGLQHTAPEEYRPLAEMFFHLEEAAIGGKHGVLNSTLYKMIGTSVKEGGDTGVNMMTDVIRAIMGEGERSGSITNQFGVTTSHTLKIDPRRWAEQAITSADLVSKDVDVAMRTVSRAAGKQVGDIQLNKLVEEFYARQYGNIDVSQAVMQSVSEGSSFTSKASRMVRRGAVKAKGLLGIASKVKGPALIGGAVAAGIMLAAPNVSGSLSAPRVSPVGGRSMSYEDYGPVGGPGMNPPPPGPNISPSVYDTGGAQQIVNANIRMRIDDLNSNSRDFMRSAREMSQGSNVNIRTRDDRSILDPRSLASKIHERL